MKRLKTYCLIWSTDREICSDEVKMIKKQVKNQAENTVGSVLLFSSSSSSSSSSSTSQWSDGRRHFCLYVHISNNLLLSYFIHSKHWTPIGLRFRWGRLSNQTRRPDTSKMCPSVVAAFWRRRYTAKGTRIGSTLLGWRRRFNLRRRRHCQGLLATPTSSSVSRDYCSTRPVISVITTHM